MADLHHPAAEVPPEAALPLPPADPATLAQWRCWAAAHVVRERLLPPLSRDELVAHADWLVRQHDLPPEHKILVALLVSNAVWHSVVAAVPFDRRLLLLPLCLSNRAMCRGERDEVGLICAHCGACVLDRIVREAHRLGMVTLIAEGATVVRMLLSDGKIDAVIGVGCLDTLTRLFPDLSRHAIPGIGMPLLTTGCQDTTLEVESLLELMREQAPHSSARLPDLDWHEVLDAADRWKLGFALHITLLVTRRWLGTPVPDTVTARLAELAQDPIAASSWGLGDESQGRAVRRAVRSLAALGPADGVHYAAWLALRTALRPLEIAMRRRTAGQQ